MLQIVRLTASSCYRRIYNGGCNAATNQSYDLLCCSKILLNFTYVKQLNCIHCKCSNQYTYLVERNYFNLFSCQFQDYNLLTNCALDSVFKRFLRNVACSPMSKTCNSLVNDIKSEPERKRQKKKKKESRRKKSKYCDKVVEESNILKVEKHKESRKLSPLPSDHDSLVENSYVNIKEEKHKKSKKRRRRHLSLVRDSLVENRDVNIKEEKHKENKKRRRKHLSFDYSSLFEDSIVNIREGKRRKSKKLRHLPSDHGSLVNSNVNIKEEKRKKSKKRRHLLSDHGRLTEENNLYVRDKHKNRKRRHMSSDYDNLIKDSNSIEKKYKKSKKRKRRYLSSNSDSSIEILKEYLKQRRKPSTSTDKMSQGYTLEMGGKLIRDDIKINYKSKKDEEDDDIAIIGGKGVARKHSLGSASTHFDLSETGEFDINCLKQFNKRNSFKNESFEQNSKKDSDEVNFNVADVPLPPPLEPGNLNLEERLRLGSDEATPKPGCSSRSKEDAVVDTDNNIPSKEESSGTLDCEDGEPTSRATKKDKILIEKLKHIRPNEYTVRGQGLLYEPWHPKEKKYQFRVLSYNVLSQTLLEMNRQLYRNHHPAHLNWTHRGPLLMNELKMIDADILCLQEVEASYKESFFDQLEHFGYKGVFKKRTGDKVDGCAIYYKTSRFGLLEHTTVEFNQPGVDVLNRDNIGLILKLHPVGWPRQPLVVATTHLIYNPRRHDVKLAQMQVLLAEIERFAYNSKYANFTYHPVILAGDFNLQPYTAIYHLLMGNSLQYEMLDRKMLQPNGPGPMLGKYLLPPYLGINDYCQHTEVLQIRDEGFGTMSKVQEKVLGIINTDKMLSPKICEVCEKDQRNFCSGVLSHKFEFESVYYHQDEETKEPEATTNHNEWITVDYMLYTPQVDKKYEHHQLQLINRTRLPTARECHHYIRHLPNSVCPSDHLPLIASFFMRLRPLPQTPPKRKS